MLFGPCGSVPTTYCLSFSAFVLSYVVTPFRVYLRAPGSFREARYAGYCIHVADIRVEHLLRLAGLKIGTAGRSTEPRDRQRHLGRSWLAEVCSELDSISAATLLRKMMQLRLAADPCESSCVRR